MSRRSTSNANYSVSNKNAINGRKGSKYVLPTTLVTGLLADRVYVVQEMQDKYRKSKEELDELVANMEGL